MKFNQGDKFIYFIKYDGDKGFDMLETEVAKDSDSIFPTLEITKIHSYPIGNGPVQLGRKISANQLAGIGLSGPDKYLFKTHKALFDRIFS